MKHMIGISPKCKVLDAMEEGPSASKWKIHYVLDLRAKLHTLEFAIDEII